MDREATDDALYGVAHVLRGGDDEGTGEQQHRGEHIVQPEYGVVSLYVLVLKVHAQSTE